MSALIPPGVVAAVVIAAVVKLMRSEGAGRREAAEPQEKSEPSG
ncbi:hypothetical protein Skr01_37840 [Sphaerisporangium krabiense]|nr:hypothetical protein Skr01_37840 [Sphaerisporangium krabiense]